MVGLSGNGHLISTNNTRQRGRVPGCQVPHQDHRPVRGCPNLARSRCYHRGRLRHRLHQRPIRGRLHHPPLAGLRPHRQGQASVRRTPLLLQRAHHRRRRGQSRRSDQHRQDARPPHPNQRLLRLARHSPPNRAAQHRLAGQRRRIGRSQRWITLYDLLQVRQQQHPQRRGRPLQRHRL